jgi:hypothetical protein
VPDVGEKAWGPVLGFDGMQHLLVVRYRNIVKPGLQTFKIVKHVRRVVLY